MASIRLASFNVENMFDRPKAMSRDGANQAPEVLAAHARVNQLIARDVYDEATKVEILDQLKILGLLAGLQHVCSVAEDPGPVPTRRRTGETLVAAAGRASWVGWS